MLILKRMNANKNIKENKNEATKYNINYVFGLKFLNSPIFNFGSN